MRLRSEWIDRALGRSFRFKIPRGVEIVQGPNGPRFRGDAEALLAVSNELRKLKNRRQESVTTLAQWRLRVSEYIPTERDVREVVLPARAWNIAASKFAEVATAYETSPFDFADCAYLTPRPNPDIGVELLGEPFPEGPLRRHAHAASEQIPRGAVRPHATLATRVLRYLRRRN